MSKFRARALDATKPMPIYRNEELPDLPDFAAINRAVPQMPSGMEKEEECEHHLQRAISAQQAYGQTGDLVIPTPEVYECANSYEHIYPEDFKIPRQFIHMQPSAMEQDIPDYDMDSEDERWVLEQQSRRVDVTPLQFEEMMDRLEKGSGQHAVSWKEAKALLDDDDDLVTSVYDYWLNKRLRTQHALIPQVRTERRDGSTNNNPYVAFRRRTEKMQTRKNRKNDEASYEKMLKLRRDLSRAVTLIEMVKRREKAKREHLHLNIEVFEKRFQASDFSGQLLAEVAAASANRSIIGKQSHCVTASAVAAAAASSYMSSIANNRNQHVISRQADQWSNRFTKVELPASRKKRVYKKRKHKDGSGGGRGSSNLAGPSLSTTRCVDRGYGLSSEDDLPPCTSLTSEPEFENDPDGRFAFRRKSNCSYLAPILEGPGNWPWCSASEGGLADRTYRYCLTSISAGAYFPNPAARHCIGFARRRVGRGGRCLLDRAHTILDDWILDHPTALDPRTSCVTPNGLLQPPSPVAGELLAEIKSDWLHFRPRTPPSPILPEPQEEGQQQQQNLQRTTSSELPSIEVVAASNVCSKSSMFFSDGSAAETYSRTMPTGGDDRKDPDVHESGVAVYDDCGSGNGGVATSEFSVESFQSHQEELLEMQRRQLERLTERDSSKDAAGGSMATEDGGGGRGYCLSSSSSRFTVDSASAQFAVSAVVTTTTRMTSAGCSPHVMAPTTALTTTTTSAATAAKSTVNPGCRSSYVTFTNGPTNLKANSSGGGGFGASSSSVRPSSATAVPLVLGKASMRTALKSTGERKLTAHQTPSVNAESVTNSCDVGISSAPARTSTLNLADPMVTVATVTTPTTVTAPAPTVSGAASSAVKMESMVIENSVPMEVT